MNTQRYVLLVGLALMGIGIVLGLLIPVSVDGDSGSQSCGAPWTGGQPIVANHLLYGSKATDYAGLCADARQTRGTIAIVLIGIGAVTAGASFIRRNPTTVTPRSVVPSG